MAAQPIPMQALLSPARAQESPRVLLVGTAGSTTASVGRLLAERLDTVVIDIDEAFRLTEKRRGPGRVVWLRTAAEKALSDSLRAEFAEVTVDVDDLEPWQAAQRALDGLGLGVLGWLPGAFEGIVVDLDGLLVDTEVIWEEAKRRLYAARGLPFSIEDHRAVLGTSEDYTVKVFAERFGASEDEHPQIKDEYLGHASALFEEGVPTRPGARELLASIYGRVPLGLASNTRRELVEVVLERANLGPFDAITTGDEAAPKPAPGLYREACRRLGIDPARSCAIEDSPTGVRGAKAAGLTCVAVPSDADNVPEDADRIVASLLDLVEPTGD